jgi:hypothetical protein
MEKSILRKLFDGEVYPSENMRIINPEYLKAKKALTDAKERFIATLSTEGINAFQKIEALYDEITMIYNYEDFAYGYRLAISLIFDTMKESETSDT